MFATPQLSRFAPRALISPLLRGAQKNPSTLRANPLWTTSAQAHPFQGSRPLCFSEFHGSGRSTTQHWDPPFPEGAPKGARRIPARCLQGVPPCHPSHIVCFSSPGGRRAGTLERLLILDLHLAIGSQVEGRWSRRGCGTAYRGFVAFPPYRAAKTP